MFYARPRSLRAAALALAVTLGGTLGAQVPAASASPLFELVGDPSGDGGLTARVNARGASAAYFNPALLAGAEAGVDLGVFFLVNQIGIVVDGRGSSPLCDDRACDVPEADGRGPESFRHEGDGEGISDPTIPTSWLEDGHDTLTARPRQGAGTGQQTRAYQTIGLVAPIFRGRVTLGLFAMIPLGEFTTAKAFYNDEREQYFSNSLHPELYGDRLTATSLAFGGGIRLRDDLSVGATFTLSLANEASAPVYVSNLNDLQTVLLDSDIAVKAAVAPHFGLAWNPVRRARVAATVHTAQAFRISTGFNYTLATGSEQSTTLHFTHSYMPLTIAAGGSYQVSGDEGADGLSVTALVTWARWSQYRDRHDVQPIGEYRWSDTLATAAGVRYVAGPLRARLDATFQPTPVPPQTGRSNYVDSDRYGAAAGVERDFTLWGSRFRAGIDAVGHRVTHRHVTKFIGDGVDVDYVIDEVPDDSIDVFGNPVGNREGLQTNNPGFPGFASGGWIFGGGVRLAIEY
jgi:long-chain fatty acid transport protein